MLPRNSLDLIRRVMARFGLDAGSTSRSSRTAARTPTCRSTSPHRCSAFWAAASSCRTLPPAATSRSSPATPTTRTQRAALEALAGDDEESQARYRDQVLAPNRSLLDLLDQFPACRLPFEEYLDMLPPLRPRYYSISSSPLVGPDVCSITAGVLPRPGAVRHRDLHRGVLELPRAAAGERHGVRLRPRADHRRSGRRRTRMSR